MATEREFESRYSQTRLFRMFFLLLFGSLVLPKRRCCSCFLRFINLDWILDTDLTYFLDLKLRSFGLYPPSKRTVTVLLDFFYFWWIFDSRSLSSRVGKLVKILAKCHSLNKIYLVLLFFNLSRFMHCSVIYLYFYIFRLLPILNTVNTTLYFLDLNFNGRLLIIIITVYHQTFKCPRLTYDSFTKVQMMKKYLFCYFIPSQWSQPIRDQSISATSMTPTSILHIRKYN